MTYQRLITITLVLVYALVILGGATRVFDAGTSCPDWPHCYGVWWPWPEARVPGGYIVGNIHFIWPQVALEWLHRAVAGVVGALMLGMVGYSFMRPQREWLPLGVAVFLLIIQGLLGGVTVLRANVPWSVAVHLATAMLFFGALLWLRWTVMNGENIKPFHGFRPARIYGWAMAAGVLVLMSVGGYVSSSHAGGVCGGLFACAGDWFPVDLQQHSHMMHRYLALAVLLASGGLISVIKRLGPKQLRGAALRLHLLLWGQAGLGVLTLYSFSDYPVYYELLSVAHLAWGTLVWVAAVSLLLGLKGVRGSVAKVRDSAAFGTESVARMTQKRAQGSRKRAKVRKTPRRGH